MFRRRGSRREGEDDAKSPESNSALTVITEEELKLSNENENAKKEKEPSKTKIKNKEKKDADKKKSNTKAGQNAKKSRSKLSQNVKKSGSRLSAGKSKSNARLDSEPTPPPLARNNPPQYQYQPPPSPPPPAQESAASVEGPLSEMSSAVVNFDDGEPDPNGHDPSTIHRILTKIHFPAMHPTFLAENVAEAVLPSHLLTDHEMVTIFIDCLSRSPNKLGLFPSDKRAITPLLSVRPLRSTERPFTIEYNPRDRVRKELRQRIQLVSGLPPDRYMLKSENPDIDRLLQEAPEGATVADLGLKEGDKIDLVQTIRVKVVGPLADDYRPNAGGGGGASGCATGCSGVNDRQRNTLGTLDVMETDKMRDLKPKVQRVLEDKGLSGDGLVFKAQGNDVRDSAPFIECGFLDGQSYEKAPTTTRSRPPRDASGGNGVCSAGCSGKPQQQQQPAEEFCGMSNCDEKRCRGACHFPST